MYCLEVLRAIQLIFLALYGAEPKPTTGLANNLYLVNIIILTQDCIRNSQATIY